MKNLIVSLLLGLAAPLTLAKLPAPPTLDAAAQAKADEAKAKTAWQAKVDAFQLCKSQDRVVAHYRKTAPGKPAGTPASATPSPPTNPASAPAGAGGPGSAGGAGGAPSSGGAASPVSVSTAAPAASAPCLEPGPFAYTPPEQKPLEASGAHSPTGTASSPPSTSVPEAATPDKK